MSPDDPRHGTNAGYVAGCRCRSCKAAKLRYDKTRKHELATTGLRRVVPAVGFRRRVRALQAIGWSFSRIAPHLGMGVSSLASKLTNGEVVSRRNHEAMVRVYDQLSMVTPTGPYVERNRRRAQQQGWAPPLAWDDIDDPDAQPHGFTPGRYPNRQVHPDTVEELLDLGLTRDGIAQRLGVRPNTLQVALTRQGRTDLWQRISDTRRAA